MGIKNKNRGMMLENIINKTISLYRRNNIALFHKKELAISFSNISESNGKLKIDNGFVKSKSTTDYYGVYKGTFYAFEAKSTNLPSLPIANIKEHQLKYLYEVLQNGGKAFFIVCFQKYDEYYIIYPDTINNLNRKSLSIDIARQEGIRLELIYPGILDFVELIK